MFGSLQTTIAATYSDAATRLIRLLHGPALKSASHAAYDTGQEMLMTIGPFGAVAGLSKLVKVLSLRPREGSNNLSVALRWEATGPTGALFPVLDADLTLCPAETSETTSDHRRGTRLLLIYSYRPPLGRLGAAMDTVVLGRVATATIKSLLDNLAGLLAESAPEQQVFPDSPQLRIPR